MHFLFPVTRVSDKVRYRILKIKHLSTIYLLILPTHSRSFLAGTARQRNEKEKDKRINNSTVTMHYGHC